MFLLRNVVDRRISTMINTTMSTTISMTLDYRCERTNEFLYEPVMCPRCRSLNSRRCARFSCPFVSFSASRVTSHGSDSSMTFRNHVSLFFGNSQLKVAYVITNVRGGDIARSRNTNVSLVVLSTLFILHLSSPYPRYDLTIIFVEYETMKYINERAKTNVV